MPTIGNTGVGASSASLGTIWWGDGPFTPASNGDASSISVYSNSSADDRTVGLYDSTPSALHRDSAGESSSHSAGGDWYTYNLDSSFSITTSNSYWLIVASQTTYRMYYDTATGEGGWTNNHSYVSGTMADPITMDSTSYNRRVSIYATYTETGTTGVNSLTLLGVG